MSCIRNELYQFLIPDGQSRISRWKADNWRRALCIGLCISTEAPYVLDQLDRAIETTKIVCYIAKATRGDSNKWSTDHIGRRMRQRTICSHRRKGSASLSLAVCPNIGIVGREIRRGVYWFEESTARPPLREITRTVAQILRLLRLFAIILSHSFVSTIPKGLRRSKWNYRVIRGPVTSTGFKGGYLDARLLCARFIFNQEILQENVLLVANIVKSLIN